MIIKSLPITQEGGNSCCLVLRPGIEPGSKVQETYVLSIELSERIFHVLLCFHRMVVQQFLSAKIEKKSYIRCETIVFLPLPYLKTIEWYEIFEPLCNSVMKKKLPIKVPDNETLMDNLYLLNNHKCCIQGYNLLTFSALFQSAQFFSDSKQTSTSYLFTWC